jgi:hypothetical protein
VGHPHPCPDPPCVGKLVDGEQTNVVRDEPGEVDDGRSFSWDCASSGVRTVVEQVLTPRVAGGCTATLRVIHHGPAAGLGGAVLDRLTRRYLRTKADGLKARCEGRRSLSGSPGAPAMP